MMIDQKKTSDAPSATGFSEAESMAKIRELLVGPAIADESARVESSFVRLDELAKEQQEAISTLQAKVRELEENQRVGLKRMRMRLLGVVEALTADEDELRARLTQHEALLSKLEIDHENDGA